ncbi:MAG: YjgP/YjgQ family permease [Candidatus Eisenbacteria bacterium]|uniref:YjgP/YjgQ family permease n=1 Tax=Eiseniibacteriota bacterium TaxID=2212470 RepID=A0A849SPQ8_UNCEI|nr:YjgP/YjgQ family permease [Candidatus Eisenbacteria bacterium]
MRILDRYILREFSIYVVLGLFGICTLFVIVDVFEKIDVFLDNRAPIALILRFYAYRVPEWSVLVMPIALLLATFLSMGQLNKFGELTAMRSNGISLLRILSPVLGLAALATVAAFVFNEAVVPHANRERDRIYRERIRHIQRPPQSERADVTYLGQRGRIFYIRLYVIPERRMHEVTMQEFRAGNLVRRIDAAEATWQGGRWEFTSGFVRTFSGTVEKAEPFARLAVTGILERPEDFARETREPDEMNVFELRDYITRLRSSGARVANYLVDLHAKLALPLVNFIVVLIGAPLATRLRLQSAALGFGLSIAIAFVFYAFMRAGQAFGHSGVLPPQLAAWLGDLAFGSVGLVMMVRAHRE